MVRPELVVAIRQHEERGDLPDAAAEERDQVERRRVRPVQVLEHDDHRRVLPELFEDRGEDHPRRSARFEPPEQCGARLLGDVVDGPQRPRGVEGIAGAPQRAARLPTRAREAVDERGLADSRLAVQQRDAPLAVGDLTQGAL